MRIFSLPNILLILVIMLTNGNVMQHLPQPLRQLMGSGIAVARADKFDMGALLRQVAAQQQAAVAAAQPRPAPVAIQPFDFAEPNFAGGAGNMEITIKAMPFPKKELEAAMGPMSNLPPSVQAEVKAIINDVMRQMQGMPL